MSYLLNILAGKPVVGLADDGSLATIHHTCCAKSTYQQKVDIVHDANTYDGKDDAVLEFFSRKKGDELYGILYTKDSKELTIKARQFINAINGLFGDEAENMVQLKDDMLSSCMHNADLFPEDTVDEIVRKTIIGYDSEYIDSKGTEIISFRIHNNVTLGTVYQQQGFVWYKDEHGKLIHNCVVPKFGNLRYNNTGEIVQAAYHYSDVSVSITLPEYVDEYYTIVKSQGRSKLESLISPSEDRRVDNLITYTVIKNKVIKGE